MKKLLLLLLCTIALISNAQSLRVNRGHIHEVFNATPDEMQFGTDTSLPTAVRYTVTIGGVTYLTSEIDSIVVSAATTDSNSVAVVYNSDGTADVTISGDIAPHLTVAISGQDVSLTATETYQDTITYTLTGQATDGSFTMDGEYATNVVLNNVSITSSDTAAINIRNGKHCYIYVYGENNFADGATGGQKAAFFCNGHATFRGDGTVNITGNARHGYRSDEYTKFTTAFTGNFNILSAASDGINVQQYLKVSNGNITVRGNTGDAIDVGINSDSTKQRNGQVIIEGGTITAAAINTDTKALKADSAITITGGTLNIIASGLGSKGISAGTNLYTRGGTFNITASGDTYNYTDETGQESDSKCQGIRSKADFYLLGDATTHPTFNVTVTSSDEDTYGIRIKGYFYYTKAALKPSGFPTKLAKWESGQAKAIDDFSLEDEE